MWTALLRKIVPVEEELGDCMFSSDGAVRTSLSDRSRTSLAAATNEPSTLVASVKAVLVQPDHMARHWPSSVALRLVLCARVGHRPPFVLDETPRRFIFPKLETAVSSASSTPTKSPWKRIITEVNL